jgi:hypothetical protein
MQLKGIETSQSIRFIVPKERAVPGSPVPLIRALQDRYGFAQVPHTLEEMNLQTGVNFLQGYWNDVLINKLSVYSNGFLVESKLDTDLMDNFLDHLLAWVLPQFEIEVEQTGVRAYVSQLEVAMPIDIGVAFKKFSDVGRLIASTLKKYGQIADDYQISSLKMHYDPVGKTDTSREFAFERRVAEPYSAGHYFSSAPLKTDDHLRILDLFEKALA